MSKPAEQPAADATGDVPSFLELHPLRYPKQYGWLVFLAAMDILFTWMILTTGGSELNQIAEAVIIVYGSTGMILFKFCLVVFVIVICEWVGRKDDAKGKRLAEWMVAIAAIPVVIGFVLFSAASLAGLHETAAIVQDPLTR